MSARLNPSYGKSIPAAGMRVSAASLLLTAAALLPLLAGCLNSAPLPTATPSPNPATRTPTFIIPTLIPTTTWTPRIPPLATSSFDAGMGAIIFQDDFEQDLGWDLGEDFYGATALTSGRLTLAARQPDAWRFATSPTPTLTDFYVEINLRAEICSSGDEFGLIFRSDPMIGQYRFGLRCEGGVRANRAVGNAVFALVSRDQTNIIVPGPPQENQLAVWVSGNQFRFFVNQVETFSVRDSSLIMGSIGVYIHSGNTGQTTVSFDNLIVRSPTPAPTNTPTPDFPEEADGS